MDVVVPLEAEFAVQGHQAHNALKCSFTPKMWSTSAMVVTHVAASGWVTLLASGWETGKAMDAGWAPGIWCMMMPLGSGDLRGSRGQLGHGPGLDDRFVE